MAYQFTRFGISLVAFYCLAFFEFPNDEVRVSGLLDRMREELNWAKRHKSSIQTDRHNRYERRDLFEVEYTRPHVSLGSRRIGNCLLGK